MNTYWLYLEPYTMVLSEKEKSLIYNSLSGEYLLISNEGEKYHLLQRILLSPDIYLLQLTEKELFEKEIIDFVKDLQSKLLGEFIDCRLTTKKPVILYPKLKLMRSINDLKAMGSGMLSYLQKIVIQITGKCACECSVCTFAYKQVEVCNKLFNKELEFGHLIRLIVVAQNTSARSVDIIGGNPFSYSSFEKLLEVIKMTPALRFNIKCFPEHFSVLADGKVLTLLKTIPNINLHIQCITGVSMIRLKEIQLQLTDLGIPHEIEFLISSEEQYRNAIGICDSLSLKQYEVTILLDNANIDFAENMYLDKDDVLSSVSSKKDVYRRQSINTFDFGKIIILSNGDVHSNLNFKSTGNIYQEDFSIILSKELKEGKSWFRIRDTAPCNDCIYQWLCPSPSNYEIVLGRSNLCHIK